jgi:hypothetical protein
MVVPQVSDRRQQRHFEHFSPQQVATDVLFEGFDMEESLPRQVGERSVIASLNSMTKSGEGIATQPFFSDLTSLSHGRRYANTPPPEPLVCGVSAEGRCGDMETSKCRHCGFELCPRRCSAEIGCPPQPRLDLPPPCDVQLQSVSVDPAQWNGDRHAGVRNVFQKPMQRIETSWVSVFRPAAKRELTFVAIDSEDHGSAEAARDGVWLAPQMQLPAVQRRKSGIHRRGLGNLRCSVTLRRNDIARRHATSIIACLTVPEYRRYNEAHQSGVCGPSEGRPAAGEDRRMIRTCFVVVAGICGVVSTASGQVFTSYDSAAYTTYYAPSYAYSSYGYSDGWGPLGLVNWRRPFAGYGGAYTAGYAPSSYYAPATTSYYAPLVDTSVAYYSAPASSACCTPCCTPCCASACGSCSSCSSGNCPGGNCALNYSPTDLSPRPDGISSGSRTIESESDSKNSGGGTTGSDDWRSRPADGYNGTERGASYPPTRIQQKAPTNVNDGAGGAEENAAGVKKSAPKAEEEAVPEAPASEANDAAEPEAEQTFQAPGDGPAASLLNRDAQVTRVPGLARERLSLRARFQSPRLARAAIDVKTIATNEGVRLVQK